MVRTRRPKEKSPFLAKSPYNAFCTRCCKVFSNKWNYRRHFNKRVTPCHIGERIGRYRIKDERTGLLRFLNAAERAEREKVTGREYYVRKREDARSYQRVRRGRKGTMPETELFRWNIIRWRRIIRSVYYGKKEEDEIDAEAIVLATEYTPGDQSVTPYIKEMYKKMGKIYADYPDYWDSVNNIWVDENFYYDSSGSEELSDLEEICNPKFREDQEYNDEEKL